MADEPDKIAEMMRANRERFRSPEFAALSLRERCDEMMRASAELWGQPGYAERREAEADRWLTPKARAFLNELRPAPTKPCHARRS